MVKMVDTLTQPATAGLEHPRRRARVASPRSSISLEHPQGVFRGAPLP